MPDRYTLPSEYTLPNKLHSHSRWNQWAWPHKIHDPVQRPEDFRLVPKNNLRPPTTGLYR